MQVDKAPLSALAGGDMVKAHDGSFAPVNLGPNAFRDWRLPWGYAPFNVQNIGGKDNISYLAHCMTRLRPLA